MKWIYKTDYMPTLLMSNYPDWEAVKKVLAENGAEGWQLVQIIPECRQIVFKMLGESESSPSLTEQEQGELWKDVSMVMVNTKHRLDLGKSDTAVFAVDIPKVIAKLTQSFTITRKK